MNYALGIDIGGTNVKAVRVSADGQTLEKYSFPTKDGGQPGFITAVPEFVKTEEAKHGKALSVGVSSPGLAAKDYRTIINMEGRMKAVVGHDWGKALGRTDLVPVLNDAHAALMGEVWLGAAKGAQDAVLLTLGTGVGGAILSEGRLLRGHLGRGGHLGHMSLDIDGPLDIVNTPGSIELMIGEAALSSRTGKYPTTRDLVDAAKAGDKEAEALWDRSIKALAAHIVSVCNAVDPETVIIGGGMIGAGDALFKPLQKYMDQFEWRPIPGVKQKVVVATLGDYSGAYGCAYMALKQNGQIT
jgi:glucokinase